MLYLTALFESSQPDIVEMLAREATRKINAIFSQLSSMLHKETQTLRAKVGKLEGELNTMTKNFENAKLWRENVLKGCPVLCEESGLIFALKLFGKLMKKTDQLTGAVAGFPHAAMQSEHEAGTFQLKEKSTTKTLSSKSLMQII